MSRGLGPAVRTTSPSKTRPPVPGTSRPVHSVAISPVSTRAHTVTGAPYTPPISPREWLGPLSCLEVRAAPPTAGAAGAVAAGRRADRPAGDRAPRPRAPQWTDPPVRRAPARAWAALRAVPRLRPPAPGL